MDAPESAPSLQPAAGSAAGPGAGHAEAGRRIAKNSMWLIAQPLVLNAISIFATAYIARTLGPEDYGRFVFALAFIAFFMPFTNLGLRTISTRDLATTEKANAAGYVGRITTLRLLLSILMAGICILAAVLGDMAPATARTVYLASAIIVLQAISGTATDVFQAFEDMRPVAEVQFIAGLTLTIGSVLALFLGWGLTGLMASYVVGNLLGASLSLWYLYTRLIPPLLVVDWAFWRQSLWRAAPLFVPNLVMAAGTRVGVMLLAAMSGQAAVGAYGAAFTLVDRLSIVPDGVCTAMFPTLASTYARSREDAAALYRRVFRYFLILALPIAVGTSVVAGPIVSLMYGKDYGKTGPILAVLAWGLFASFFAQLATWTVGAIKQERRGFHVPIVATVVFMILSAALIPKLEEMGLALAGIVFAAALVFLNDRILREHLGARGMARGDAGRVILASAIMGVSVWLVRGLPVWISIPVGAAVYAAALFAVRAVAPSELRTMLGLFRGRVGA
jgi:O-antigen/teichoic acid export membrane protein